MGKRGQAGGSAAKGARPERYRPVGRFTTYDRRMRGKTMPYPGGENAKEFDP